MNRDDIIRMAREAGISNYSDYRLESFARLIEHIASVKEREACAKVAEDTDRMVLALLNVTSQHKHIAAAIRARKMP